jgi:mRNA-degrading endonuclease RelE of RelBE toxin-antitoxin system
MFTVVETSLFSRQADELPLHDRAALITALATAPFAGDLVPGLGGVRKLRWAPKGRGKRGGYRVIYYVLNETRPVLALLLYAKNQQADIGADQRKAILSLIARLKD